MVDYAKAVREYRERRFLTQGALAEILGVSHVTVCRWETGAFEPNMAMKRKLAELFEEAGMSTNQ